MQTRTRIRFVTTLSRLEVKKPLFSTLHANLHWKAIVYIPLHGYSLWESLVQQNVVVGGTV